MQSRKPDGIHGLVFFRDDIVTLYASGYSLKSILEYVKANGYQAGYSAMCKWIAKNMNLEQEAIEFMKKGGVRIEKNETKVGETVASDTKPKPEAKPEIKAATVVSTVSPRETHEESPADEPINTNNEKPSSNAERLEKMKASMDKLLGGESFDEQFAALNKEKNPADKETGRD